MKNLNKFLKNQEDNMKSLVKTNVKPLDAIEGVLDNFEVAEIAEQLKLRLNMPKMDLDSEILLEQIVIMTIRMYLSKEQKTNLVQ